MFLSRIISTTEEDIALRKKKHPLRELERAIDGMPPTRDFHDAIAGPEVALIAEVKKSSPSRGCLRPDFDPVSIARAYERAGVAAISVLTEKRFFEGSEIYLTDIRRHVSPPLLRKDFIIDPYQVVETRFLGADATLLIARLFTEESLREMIALARSLTLDALVEVHTQKELDRACAAGAAIIGINNRDLTTFVTDIDVTIGLAPAVPAGKTIVSESGITGRADIEHLQAHGVHAVLVGEMLMKSPSIETAVTELMGVHERP